MVWAVIGGFIDYLIGILHDISREYRSISKILAEEKESEKKRMRVRHTDQTNTNTSSGRSSNFKHFVTVF